MSAGVARFRDELMQRLTADVRVAGGTSPEAMWLAGEAIAWQCPDGVYPAPWFYPVYRYNDLYSTSPLVLMLRKGAIRINPRTDAAVSSADFRHCPDRDFVDVEIARIGGPLRSSRTVRREDDFASLCAAAMKRDVALAERSNPQNVNVVLCGGRDSLNLLLLPWENQTIVASGPPNTELVREFIERNELSYDVVVLQDGDNALLGAEILANCCRSNLEHCRWSAHLVRMAEEHQRRVTFWKGQAADVLLSDSWVRYQQYEPAVRPAALYDFYRNSLRAPLQWKLAGLADHFGWSQRRFYSAVWSRAAMWQGAHLSMLRDLTGAVVLSGYQGPEMTKVFSRVDVCRAVRRDVRGLIGRLLLGREVWYPKDNPSPPLCPRPSGASSVKAFLSELRSVGVRVV